MRRTTTYVAAFVAVCSAGLAACMGGDQPLAPQSASVASSQPVATTNQRGLLGGLLGGGNDQIEYFVCHGNGGPYTGSATIGLLGGKVVFGPHELDVPPAALLTPTTITATTIPGDTIAVQFQPQGLKFLLPATLQLSYAQCQPQPSGNLSIVYVNDLLNQLLGLIQSIVDPAQQKVIGLISHFSVYAIAE
jgi:hypothetical protein